MHERAKRMAPQSLHEVRGSHGPARPDGVARVAQDEHAPRTSSCESRQAHPLGVAADDSLQRHDVGRLGGSGVLEQVAEAELGTAGETRLGGELTCR